MKHLDLIRRITDEGAVFVRSCGGHDIYRSVITGATQPVPRHREVNELTAKSIIRHLAAPETAQKGVV